MAIIFRVVGYALLAFSFLVAGTILLLWMDGKNLAKPLGEVWVLGDPTSYSQVQRGIQQFINPDLWDGYGVPFLELPAWLGLGIMTGAGMIMAGLFLIGGRQATIRNKRRRLRGKYKPAKRDEV